MVTLQREMDRMFDTRWPGAGLPLHAQKALNLGGVRVSIDQTEDDKAYHVTVELPGISEKEVEVTLSDGMLTIRGEKN